MKNFSLKPKNDIIIIYSQNHSIFFTLQKLYIQIHRIKMLSQKIIISRISQVRSLFLVKTWNNCLRMWRRVFYDSLTIFNVYLFCHIQILVIIRSMCKCWTHNPSYKKRNLCFKFKQKKVFPFSTPFIFFCFVNLKWCVCKRNTRLFMFELIL